MRKPSLKLEETTVSAGFFIALLSQAELLHRVIQMVGVGQLFQSPQQFQRCWKAQHHTVLVEGLSSQIKHREDFSMMVWLDSRCF